MTAALSGLDGGELCNGLAGFRDDDFLAVAGTFDQLGKLGLRVVDVDLHHLEHSTLGKLIVHHPVQAHVSFRCP